MSGKTTRVPDCVTRVHMGNTVLTVSGFLKQDATDTAADKMMRVLKAESAIAADGGAGKGGGPCPPKSGRIAKKR